jgi:hypothetical protein
MLPLKELETESAGMQTTTLSQLFVSLLRLGGGWCANKSLQPTRGVALGSSRSRGLFYVAVPACLSSSR